MFFLFIEGKIYCFTLAWFSPRIDLFTRKMNEFTFSLSLSLTCTLTDCAYSFISLLGANAHSWLADGESSRVKIFIVSSSTLHAVMYVLSFFFFLFLCLKMATLAIDLHELFAEEWNVTFYSCSRAQFTRSGYFCASRHDRNNKWKKYPLLSHQIHFVIGHVAFISLPLPLVSAQYHRSR